MPERAVTKAVSRKTIQNVLGTLSAILTTARNWGYTCEPIKLEHLRLPARGVKYEAPSFTVEQLQRILAVAEEPGRTLFCIFTMDGLRAGEALGLQWGDIDLDRGLLHIRRSVW
jgi:integrase